jgi:hypothetical protein
VYCPEQLRYTGYKREYTEIAYTKKDLGHYMPASDAVFLILQLWPLLQKKNSSGTKSGVQNHS